MAKDIFHRDSAQLVQPITSDTSTILWDGSLLTTGISVTIAYSQGVSRRRTIGNKAMAMIGSLPYGQASIGRLLFKGSAKELFNSEAWRPCGNGVLTFNLGACGEAGSTEGSYTAIGCMVSGYHISASAEDLTIVDQITVEFAELVFD